MNKVLVSVVFVMSLILAPKIVLAWGGRGHAAICEAAVFLVKNQNLKEYLQNKPQMMGHLCNIPDTSWRSVSEQSKKYGDPTHFIDIEVLGLKIKDIPDDYKKIIATYTGSENKSKEGVKIFSIPTEFGSIWWRADQFYRLALEEGKKLKTLPAPANNKEEQTEDFPYNKAFYNLVVDLGLMGHFVGDAGQPYHNTSDYDGYASNHGGIHAYFEDASVAYFGPDLVLQITKKAKSMKSPSFLKPKSVIEKMRGLSEISNLEIKAIDKVDPVIKPSVIRIEKGMSLRTPAERKPASVGFKNFEKLILQEMARSSLLLANIWEQAYVEAGEPAMKAYKSYRYPLLPEFVMPDYFDIPKDEAPMKK